MKIAATALFALTVLKVALVVLAQPMIGYGNNYDFIRQESCVGLWQDYPDHPKTEWNLGPVNRVVKDGDLRPGLCLRSIDNVFPWAIAGVHRIGARVDFRELGVLRALTLLIAFAWVLFSIASPALRLAVSLAAHLVFGDIAYLGYLNTFYNEFSVVAGCALSLAMTAVVWLSPERPRLKTVVCLSISLVWLGLSKLQYSPLASLLGVICALVALRRWSAYRLAGCLAGLGLALPLLYRLMNPVSIPVSGSLDRCNKINAVLWGVLPSASDPIRALQTLGLPLSCASAIGQNWYTISSQQQPPCPEVLSVSRARLILLFATQPRTFFAPLHRATLESRPFQPYYLGIVEQAETQRSALFRILKATSASTWVQALPVGAYLVIVYGSMLVGVACLLWLLYREARRRRGHLDELLLILVGLGGLTAFFGVASSVFGDGFSEVPKHALGLGIGIYFIVAAGMVAGINRIRTR